jgi:hypothetical protein
LGVDQLRTFFVMGGRVIGGGWGGREGERRREGVREGEREREKGGRGRGGWGEYSSHNGRTGSTSSFFLVAFFAGGTNQRMRLIPSS